MNSLADLMQEIDVMAIGCAVVMAALALLWGLTALVGRLVELGNRIGARRAAAHPAAVAVGVPPHHLAVIAAAVAAIIEAPHRIVRVRAPGHRSAAWAGSGRISHVLRGGPGQRLRNGDSSKNHTG